MITIQLADVSNIEASKTGAVKGTFIMQYGYFNVKLKEVLFVPNLKANLRSVIPIQETGYSVTFQRNVCETIRENDGDCALRAP